MIACWCVTALHIGRTPALAADDSTFNFTAQQFVTLYNGRTAMCDDKTLFNDQNCVDKIKSIRVVADQAILSMDDSNFQVVVREFKRLGLVEGEIAFNAKIRLRLAKNGLVKSISIAGSPRDLVNWCSTVGMVTPIYELLNPGFTAESEQQFLAPLGHPTIGHPMTNVSAGRTFVCNVQRSRVSLEFGCVVVPHH
jgi:hypothetical protein